MQILEQIDNYLNEKRFSEGHYGFNSKGDMFADTGSIYILDDLGGSITHIGFGDFETTNDIKLSGFGPVKVSYIRADGNRDGDKFVKNGFQGRPHFVGFPGRGGKPPLIGTDQKRAAKELGKLYAKAGCTLVKI
jgi:hypothetical protein